MDRNVHFLKLTFSLDIKSLIVPRVRTSLSGHVFKIVKHDRGISDKNEKNVTILLIASLFFIFSFHISLS